MVTFLPSMTLQSTQFQKRFLCNITNQDRNFNEQTKMVLNSISIRYSPEEDEIKRWSNRTEVRSCRNMIILFVEYPPIFLEWSLRRDVQYYPEAKEEDERVQELLKFLFFLQIDLSLSSQLYVVGNTFSFRK